MRWAIRLAAMLGLILAFVPVGANAGGGPVSRFLFVDLGPGKPVWQGFHRGHSQNSDPNLASCNLTLPDGTPIYDTDESDQDSGLANVIKIVNFPVGMDVLVAPCFGHGAARDYFSLDVNGYHCYHIGVDAGPGQYQLMVKQCTVPAAYNQTGQLTITFSNDGYPNGVAGVWNVLIQWPA